MKAGGVIVALLMSLEKGESGVTPANQTKERPGHEPFPEANWNESSM